MKKKLIALALAMTMVVPLFSFGATSVLSAEQQYVDDPSVSAPAAWGPTPSAGQLAYQKEEMSAFIHFGMNTFTNKEWGNGSETPSQFTLSSIDADQWVKTFKDAGFGRLILVSKHHDGFCNWPSELTEHSVKNSPNKIDVVGEVSKAVTKYDMGMGVYLSPWDVNSTLYGKDGGDAYNQYYMGQLREILGNPAYGNNGKFVEVWMDGAKASGVIQPYYFTPAYVSEGQQNWRDLILSYNPEMVIFAPYGDTVRWNGTESGVSAIPCWNRINWADQKSYYDRTGGESTGLVANGQANGANWSIPEADVSLVPGWFAYNGTPKSLRSLGDIYFSSVGRSSVLLLNAAPGQNGRISDAQANRIAEFGEAIRETFKTNLALGAAVTASNTRGNDNRFKPDNVIDEDYDTYWTTNDGTNTGSITLTFDEPKTFDVVSLQEYIPLGQRISKYNIEVMVNGSWYAFGKSNECQTVGYKALVRDEAVTASAVRINITASQAVPVINSIGVYKAVDAFALPTLNVPKDAKFIDCLDPAITYSAGWSAGTGANSINDSHKWSATNRVCTATFSFTGNKFYIIGIIDPGHGAATVNVDGTDIGIANFNATSRLGKQLIYTSPDLGYGRHTVTLTTNRVAIDLDGIFYLDRGDVATYSLDKTEFNVGDDYGTLNLVVKRVGGDIEKVAKVQVYTEPGTGVHGKVFDHIDYILEFAPGETTKNVSVKILNTMGDVAMLDFYVRLEKVADDDGLIGTNSTAVVKVWNTNYDHTLSREYTRTKLPESGSKMLICSNWDYAYPAEKSSLSGSQTGSIVGWLGTTSRGDGRIKLWFDAPVAGDYKVNIRYYTGRTIENPNLMKWHGENVVAGEVYLPRQSMSTMWCNVEFTINIPSAGKGYIEFYNDVPGGGPGTEMPNLDYMTFTAPIPKDFNDLTLSETDNGVKVTLDYSKQEQVDATLIIAVYDNGGKLVASKMQNAALIGADSVELELAVDKEAYAGYTYKAFLWNKFIPMCPAVSAVIE